MQMLPLTWLVSERMVGLSDGVADWFVISRIF
jgi:hypothetical protein